MSDGWGIGVTIYAAIVATGAHFLEVRRWVESGPRLNLTVSTNRERPTVKRLPKPKQLTQFTGGILPTQCNKAVQK